jgi:hypothetical protein
LGSRLFGGGQLLLHGVVLGLRGGHVDLALGYGLIGQLLLIGRLLGLLLRAGDLCVELRAVGIGDLVMLGQQIVQKDHRGGTRWGQHERGHRHVALAPWDLEVAAHLLG